MIQNAQLSLILRKWIIVILRIIGYVSIVVIFNKNKIKYLQRSKNLFFTV